MNFTEISLGFIGVLSAILTYFLVPLVKDFIQFRLTESQLDLLNYWVEVAIRYFEINIDGSKMGAEKKKEVLNYLHKKGFDVSEDDLDKIIDTMVEQLNNLEWR